MNSEEKKGFSRFFSKQTTKYGMNTLLTILIVLGIIVFIEAISYRHHKRFDLTIDNRYSLSQQSRQILSSLQKDIKAVAFYKEGQAEKEPMKNLLEQYAYSSDHFSYEFIDPDRKPTLAEKYKIADYGTVVLESNGRLERIFRGDEQRITNGILKVIRTGKKTVYFTKGHGEHEILDFGKTGFSAAKIAMEDENYIIKDILLLREKIPEDASVLVIGGPRKDFFEQEIKEIASYLEKGGKVVFMIDPDSLPRIREFLKQYHILLGDDMIIDTLSRLFGADFLTPVVTSYEYHPITKDFNLATFFTTVRSVKIAEEKKAGASAQIIVSTGPGSWAETDRKSIEEGKPEFDETKDIKGPVPIAAAVNINKKKDDKSQNGSLVVFGDSDFANNTLINLAGNKDLFLNTIGWLAGEDALISIRKKPKNASPVVLTAIQGRIVFWSSVVILPLFILFLGIVVFRRRRRNQ